MSDDKSRALVEAFYDLCGDADYSLTQAAPFQRAEWPAVARRLRELTERLAALVQEPKA